LSNFVTCPFINRASIGIEVKSSGD
jgi:hypothetical protein